MRLLTEGGGIALARFVRPLDVLSPTRVWHDVVFSCLALPATGRFAAAADARFFILENILKDTFTKGKCFCLSVLVLTLTCFSARLFCYFSDGAF